MLAENTNPFPCIAGDTSFMAAYILNGYCSDELSDCISGHAVHGFIHCAFKRKNVGWTS